MPCSAGFTGGGKVLVEVWDGAVPPEQPPLTGGDYWRVARRGLPLGILIFGSLLVVLALRVVEAPIFGHRRPVTPLISRFVCRTALALIGIRFRSLGQAMQGPGAVVANHVSWLDIFALNARKRIYFVSKDEVSRWPGIGWLARATGTVFIKRDRREAASQIATFRDRLAVGHKLLFFPEGTSTDGLRVLRFKPTLFAAFFDPALAPRMQIQPVTLHYLAPTGADARFYGWWGDMSFGAHLLHILAAKRQGSVTVTYHPPLRLTDFTDRKALAQQLENTVRDGLTRHDGA